VTKLFNIGIALAAGFYFCAFAARGDDTNGSPPVEEIIRKLIERSQEKPSHLVQPEYSFTKLTEREEFDSKGRVKERKSSSNEMFFCSGVISKKPNANVGHNPSGAKKTESPGKNESAKSTKPKPANRGESINLITDEIFGKYVFTLINRTNLNGRPTFELAFQPKKKNASGKNFMERLLNRTTGKLWIDVEEFELARMQVQLESEMLVGAGLVGSLKKAAFILERARLPEGFWFERSVKTDYEARKFLESTRVITTSESSGFRKRASKG
jgi:hypothetical protein